MYIPTKFKIDDPDVIRLFIEENSFGLLLTTDGIDIHDTHTPFIYSEDGKHLLGHIAKANPQWKSWKGETTAKAIFQGPHAYISPHFYESEFAVPTWNYAAVSVVGQINVIKNEIEILDFLDRLIAHNETSSNPWVLDRSDERYTNLLSAIVTFSISIDSIEASFKMNQNKSETDQNKVIDSLTETGCPYNLGVAEMMTSNIRNRKDQKEP